MIYAVGNHQHRLLCLAREAARRFIPIRIRSATRTQLWHPVVLRWRRTRQIANGLIAHRAGHATKFLTFNQVHFQHAAYIMQRWHRSVTSLQAAAAYEKNVATRRRAALVRPTARAFRADRPDRKLVNVQLVHAKSNVNLMSVSQTSRFYRLNVFAPTKIYRRKSSLVVHRGTQSDRRLKEEPIQRERRRARSFENSLRTVSVHRQTITEYAKPTSRERKVSEVLLQSPEELVWRRSPPRHLEVADDSTGVDRTANTVPRQSVRTVPFQESTAVNASAKPTVAHVTKLDPALVDRLAEDVIRRIERRVRIERQRRGL